MLGYIRDFMYATFGFPFCPAQPPPDADFAALYSHLTSTFAVALITTAARGQRPTINVSVSHT